jgi:isoleucyl-tRNA synthetase
VELAREDVEVDLVAKEGYAAAGDRAGVVVLDTRLDDELRELGFVRELQNRIQTIRKEMGLEFTDRIRVWLSGGEQGGGDYTETVVRKHGDAVASEVLAVEILVGTAPENASAFAREVDVEGRAVRIAVARV